MRLFAFPYAGATAHVFAPLAQALAARVEVCAVEYPGHGTRWGETLLRSVDAMADGVLPALRPLLDRPFALCRRRSMRGARRRPARSPRTCSAAATSS